MEFDDAGDLARRNLFGPAIDQVLASEFVDSTNETNWYLTDHLGTVRDVYSYDDVLNDIVSEGHIEYDSFGKITDNAAAAEKAGFAFTGREYDADADLHYYRARYYDAKLGQFISQDPIGFEAGDMNVRRYVGNMPVMAIDPTGNEGFVSDYAYFINREDSFHRGVGQGARNMAEGVDPRSIPGDIQRIVDPASYDQDRENLRALTSNPGAYLRHRANVVSSGIGEFFSTPAGWGEGYFNVAAMVVGHKVSGIGAKGTTCPRTNAPTKGFTGSGMSALDEAAENAYNAIRAAKQADVPTVANNTGLTASEIRTLKKHIFFGKHQLPKADGSGLYRSRFSAHDEIAHAWRTAQSGPLDAGQQRWFRQWANHELRAYPKSRLRCKAVVELGL